MAGAASAAGKARAGTKAKPRAKPTEKQREIGSAKRAYIRMQDKRAETARSIEQARTTELAVRQQAHIKQRQSYQTRRGVKRGLVKYGQTIAEGKSVRSAVGSVTAPAKPVVNPILLILFMWAAIVVLYALVSNPAPTSRFMQSLQQWVRQLNSTEPLFVLSNREST